MARVYDIFSSLGSMVEREAEKDVWRKFLAKGNCDR